MHVISVKIGQNLAQSGIRMYCDRQNVEVNWSPPSSSCSACGSVVSVPQGTYGLQPVFGPGVLQET